MAVFDKGNKDVVLRHLGLSYGFIYAEGLQPVMAIDIETGRHILMEWAGQGVVSYRDTDKVQLQMRRACMPENGNVVRQKLQRRPRPQASRTLLTFKVCSGCGMHGRLLDSWGKDVSREILSLIDGIGACQNLFMNSDVTPDRQKLDSVLYAVKQMAESPRLRHNVMIEGHGAPMDLDPTDLDDLSMFGMGMGMEMGKSGPNANSDAGMMAMALMRAMRPQFDGR